MPCFKGLAVSIHSDGVLPEYSIQKQSRQNRISSYIAVPPARVHKDSLTGKPEQPPFAISITLLTPGLHVPYSQAEPTPDDPYPRQRMVGGLPTSMGERGKYGPVIPPYVPQTTNPNETIAAYIYFDGRPKEEVATLLRRGEETWVNSRWVSTEGGGLAEREFLFREVGLERWLNGLDLQGTNKDKKEKIERRQQRLDRRRRRKQELGIKSEDGSDDVKVKLEDMDGMEDDMQDAANFSSLSDSDDDDAPEPEAAGQIKVALFRVLASGEIKRGEYSPQFDANDDDDGTEQNGNGEAGADEDVDHTTSFAKPKSLDPKSISTQTVTGLDPPEAPYAVFTFFYRGEKQLRKMRIFPGSEAEQTPASTKRKASGPDFSNLGPLNKFGTVGFSGYRDTGNTKRKTKPKSSDGDAMESDNDDDDDERVVDQDDADGKQENGGMLSPEDARKQGEIAEGVQNIKVSDDEISSIISDYSQDHSSNASAPPTLSRSPPPLASLLTSPPMTRLLSAPRRLSTPRLPTPAHHLPTASMSAPPTCPT